MPASLFAGQTTIKALQKRIKKDRSDILYYMTRLKDEEAKLKKDRSKADKYSQITPVPSERDKWNGRVDKDKADIESDRTAREKAQKDLAQANTQLSNILSKR